MSPHNTWLITGARLLDPASGGDTREDLLVLDGRIERPGHPVPARIPRIDAAGLLVAPALIDLHVHLREPGAEDAETVASGCRAAAHGGFGTVVAMPNTNPAMDAPDGIRRLRERAERCGLVRVLPAACITRGRAGRGLADLRALAEAGAVAFTDDGATVPDRILMRDAMQMARELGRPVLDHAMDARLAGPGVLHEGRRARALGLPGIPSRAEWTVVERDIELADETGCRVHIQHVSDKTSVGLLRQARRAGLPVTAEVTPHHLALTDEDIPGDDANYKMSPPLRGREDRAALLEAVAAGEIGCLATDHAPHTAAAKAAGFAGAPFGVVGLETAVGVTYSELVAPGLLGPLDWVRRWTAGPAAVLALPVPQLAPGLPADLVLLDPAAARAVDPVDFLSKSANTPFAGRVLHGAVVATFRNGCPTWAAPGLLTASA